jgi:hypothetical protein
MKYERLYSFMSITRVLVGVWQIGSGMPVEDLAQHGELGSVRSAAAPWRQAHSLTKVSLPRKLKVTTNK